MNKRIFPYTEFVDAYDRFRFNKWEHVSAYWRRPRSR